MTERRILLSYFFKDNSIPLGYSLARAFESKGFNVSCFNSAVHHPLDTFFFKPVNKLIWNAGFKSFDISRGSKRNNQGHRQYLLEQRIKGFLPHILLVLRGQGYDKDFLYYLKKRYSINKLIGWWVKGPQWVDLMKEDSKPYDHYFCIHSQHNIHGIKLLDAVAVDNRIYKKIPDLVLNKKNTNDVIFVGGWSKRRQDVISMIASFPISVWGENWRKRNILTPLWRKIKGSGIYGEALVKLYNSSKIVLNIFNWEPSSSGINLRIFDVPACSSFLLTEFSPELNRYFELGKEIETFKDTLELKDKILFYIKNEDKRKKIAHAGYIKVKKLQSYNDKVSLLLKEISYKQ